MYQLIDVRNEDLMTYDEQGVAILFKCPDASVAFGRIMPGQMGMQGLAAEGCEDNAVVLSGMLSYPTSTHNEVFVSKGTWVVARPGEVHGYWNKGGKPVTLFIFRPRASGTASPGSQRIFKPHESRALSRPLGNRLTMYETTASRGEILSLHPGEPSTFTPVLCRAMMVTSGRVMSLLGKEKVSLDSGEGLVYMREGAEVVGVGGLSTMVVFSTLY